MDRLAKKCVIASSALHGTLVLVLLVGPAFVNDSDELVRQKKTFSDRETIIIIPTKEFEASGSPHEPSSVVSAPRTRQPAVRAEVSTEDLGGKRSRQIDVNLEPVTRQAAHADAVRGTATAANGDSMEYERAIGRISSQISSALPVKTPGSMHEDGIPDAGFKDALINAYWRAWLIPTEAANETAKVVATITVRRDGTVIASSLQARTGNSALDASVQSALDTVTFVMPLPGSVKDAQRTFRLEFDPRAKRMMTL